MSIHLNIVPEPMSHEEVEPSQSRAAEHNPTDESNSLPVTLQRSMSKLNSLDITLKRQLDSKIEKNLRYQKNYKRGSYMQAKKNPDVFLQTQASKKQFGKQMSRSQDPGKNRDLSRKADVRGSFKLDPYGNQ